MVCLNFVLYKILSKLNTKNRYKLNKVSDENTDIFAIERLNQMKL